MTEVALINGERKAIYYILGQVVIHEKKKKKKSGPCLTIHTKHNSVLRLKSEIQIFKTKNLCTYSLIYIKLGARSDLVNETEKCIA